jgi:hypothetical protein
LISAQFLTGLLYPAELIVEMIRFAAAANPESDIFATVYSSDAVRFADASGPKEMVFLRNAIAHSGALCPVTSVSSKGFKASRQPVVFLSRTVEYLGPRCFYHGAISFLAFESDSRLSEIGVLAFYHCLSLVSLFIPSSVSIFDRECFESCRSLSVVTFEANSKLAVIEWASFCHCASLQSILIPSRVRTIRSPVFFLSGIREIRIAEGNRHFRVLGDQLLSFDGRFLFEYFGPGPLVQIDCEVEIIGKNAFRARSEVTQIEFENESKLRRFKPLAFADSTIRSICIPSTVEAIAGSSFANCDISEIRIAEDNRHFRICGHFLLSFDGKSLVLCFGRESAVRVDRAIEVICKLAFGPCSALSNIEFEERSKLRRIDAQAFFGCDSVDSICVPSSVHSIDGSAFCDSGIDEVRIAEDNRHFRVSGEFLLSFDGKILICYFGNSEIARIYGGIEVISTRAFAGSESISNIAFESGSRLRRIEAFAFSHCGSLELISLPSFVEAIDGSAFCGCGIREVRIAEDNCHFRMSGDFLLTSDGKTLIRYFGRGSIVRLNCEIEIVSASSFERCIEIRAVQFEPKSRVRSIMDRAFRRCQRLTSISLPASTECLCSSCFAKCTRLIELRFEAGSRLNRIAANSFEGCSSLSTLFFPESLKRDGGLDVSGAGSIPIEWYPLGEEAEEESS